MSEIKLTIDEVIEHCRKTCERAELMAQLRDAEITSKQYWEHKQVAEWLKELKQLRGAMERIIERLEGQKEHSSRIYDNLKDSFYLGMQQADDNAIEIVKEEGGMDEP